MKSTCLCKVVLGVILGVTTFLLSGCAWDQLGETTAEGHEMLADIDRVLLLDKPSRLTDKRIP